MVGNLLKTSTAEFKVPSGSTNGSTAVTIVGATIPSADVAYHVTAINHLVTKLKAVTAKFKEVAAEIESPIGQHIKAIKIAEANNWESVVKAKCGLSRSRAYELIAIKGTKSVEQSRHQNNARQIRFRQNKSSSVSVTDKKKLAAANTKIVTLEEGHQRQIARLKAEIARLSDASELSSERDALLEALNQVDELLIELRGLTRHFTQNRINIVSKINRAHEVAARMLKSAPFKSADSKSTNLPVKVATA